MIELKAKKMREELAEPEKEVDVETLIRAELKAEFESATLEPPAQLEKQPKNYIS
jgi:hypothetical protein